MGSPSKIGPTNLHTAQSPGHVCSVLVCKVEATDNRTPWLVCPSFLAHSLPLCRQGPDFFFYYCEGFPFALCFFFAYPERSITTLFVVTNFKFSARKNFSSSPSPVLCSAPAQSLPLNEPNQTFGSDTNHVK